MPCGPRREEKYSRTTGVVFIFNLIVGTGALALPGAFQQAGYILGIFLIVILALFSFATVTFLIESLAVANAVSRKHYGKRTTALEETPLFDDVDSAEDEHNGADGTGELQETNVFDITEKYEIGQMGVLMTPKWCQAIIYLCLCLYLYGDLAIYAVVIGRTCSHVLCTYRPVNGTEANLTDTDLCWKSHSLTRINFYRVSVAMFVILVGPFVFFNFQKTKVLQICTVILRWLAFFIMLIWSIQRLVVRGQQGKPPVIDLKALPTLFGTLVYSFMCQHSIPGLLHPVRNKRNLSGLIGIDYGLVAIFYLSLVMTSIFAFKHVEDLYTLNFWEETSSPNIPLFPVILAYYLAWFPVFTLATSFPIAAITLRNNLRSMIVRDAPFAWYYDRLLFPLLTLLPPTTLALAVTDLHLLVGIVGSYAGASIQYLIPSLLVFFARAQSKDFNAENIYASPFKSNYWVYAVYIWMGVSLILITINFANTL